MKLRNAVNVLTTLHGLSQQLHSARTGYHINKNLEIAKGHADDLEKARIAALQNLGTLNTETNVYDMTDENRASFTAQMEELLDSDVPVVFRPITAAMLGESQIIPGGLEVLFAAGITDEAEFDPELKAPTIN